MTQTGSTPYSDEDSSRLRRAEELDDLLSAVRELIVPFVQSADDGASTKISLSQNGPSELAPNTLVDAHKPAELVAKMKLVLPTEGQGKDGLMQGIEKVLRYSVNTWDQGFLDKLCASNNPVGVISDMVLSVLNTNLHVYQCSPALTVVEKVTAKALANMFGFTGPSAGGITCQGGSSSNMTSMVIARNTLFPECKLSGNGKHDFVAFTSVHGHYSVQKSGMVMGLGSANVWSVPADDEGRMNPDALRELVIKAKSEGKTPFYVNATAGTTVRGSFEPLEEISKLCKEFGLWMHVDASWGGALIFSRAQRWKLRGTHLANSLTMNPHKMLNVPSEYLFHRDEEDNDVWDLADLTLQCGRRGDSLKLALAWLYYGSDGFERQVDHAFSMAAYLFKLVRSTGNFAMVSKDPLPCLQVCFYYAPNGILSDDPQANTNRTRTMVEKLIGRGFMVDYSMGKDGGFFRIVVNVQTLPTTVEALVIALEEVGKVVG
ncbi:L-aspartate decarboxylase dtxS4 [Cladobotryum mycophilum]|uniref:L-aspartate decarboxylase dtxS4 n=1 Tax=Cladobotryum mycophilum TaxID=491253 RepID=A0ABR0SGY0_9HYPO